MLERALELAERGRGTTRPNPVVGAVITNDGDVVGEGWHERAGGPHAEIMALQAAGERAHGATLYVTLEPCPHHGRTPPCTEAIIAAGLRTVVVATEDSNPETSGQGIDHLRRAGIEVVLPGGDVERRARRQNEAFRTWISRGRPFVTYKAAMTLDGRLAAASGDARWVSGEDSRKLVHEYRAASDAVAVGMGTVRADNPALTARGVGATRQPRRLAFGRGPLPADSELELRTGSIEDELNRLGGEGVQSLLLEGGPTLAGAFLAADLIDKLAIFIAPKLIGGNDAPPLFAGAGASRMEDVRRLGDIDVSAVGADLLLVGYLHEP